MADAAVGTRSEADAYWQRRQALRAGGLTSTEMNAAEAALDASGLMYTFNDALDVPADPAAPTLTDVAGAHITVDFVVPAGATHVEVWGSPALVGGTYALIETVAAPTATYDDTAATEAAENFYKVRAKSVIEAGDTDYPVYSGFSGTAHVVHAAS